MIDLGKQTDIHRLYTAIAESRMALLPFRQNRHALLQEFVGSRYGQGGAQNEVLVNLLNMTAETYMVALAANNPRVFVSTEFRELRPFAYRYEKAINNHMQAMRFNQTMQAIVLDALFVRGTSKVIQSDWESVQLYDDVWAEVGRPQIARISFEDFGHDMSVKDIRRCQFMWDEYRVPWEVVKNDPDFEQSVVKQMHPTSKWDRGEAEASRIAAGNMVDDDEYQPMTDLMDVWLPELKAVGIFPKYVESKPLKVVDAGPHGGPYRFLSFLDVPDNTIPSSPMSNLLGLHLLYNGLLRKQGRQAKRQKTNPTYRPQASDDANRMKRVSDGEWVKVADPQGVNVVSQGGVDPTNIHFSISVLDLFDRSAGNLRARAGLGPQTATVGQEQLVHQAAQRKEARMIQQTHECAAELAKALGHLLWADEMMEIPSQDEIAPGIFVDTSWTPELRDGAPWKYNFEVERHSMTYVPPEVRAQKMERAIAQITQMYPILQQRGGTIDVQELIRHYARTMQLPELEDIVRFPGAPATPGPEPQMRPLETTRNYVRHNIPTGGTPESRSSILQQSLMGGGQVTPQQEASIRRPA